MFEMDTVGVLMKKINIIMEVDEENHQQCPLLDSNIWRTRSTVTSCNSFMLQNKVACDITFTLGSESQEVVAHKYVLISRSPVFYAMFCGPVAESSDVISVPDIEPDIFQSLLSYLYCDDDSVVDSDSVMALLYAAKKYSIYSLEDVCKQFLKDNINFDNACLILEQSHAFDEKDLYEECLKFIWKNGEEILEMSCVKDLCEKCMQDIIASDALNADEKLVYECVVSWSEIQCIKKKMEVNDQNQREVLSNILYQVRFPLMPLSYFADHVSEKQILSPEEKLNLYKYLCQSRSGAVTPFISRYRSKKTSLHCKRFKGMVDSSDWVQKGKKDAVSFSCSVPILMHGVCMYRSGLTGAPYDIRLELYDESDNQLTCVHRTEDTIESTVEGRFLFPVLFDQPLKILSCSYYTIVVKMIGPKSFYGERGRKKVVCGNVTFEFISAPNRSTNSTNVFTGQIPVILFSPWL
ncbi:BTB/POZ domain-containing protein 6-like [Mytilus trossulus]|uniref:BTB/POZ domain-containing protein 6-like n=1 Tax=Mytilus trossulus TaxID=6551 RepID=UPI0030078FDD